MQSDPNQQNERIRRALTRQRTLLIVDNFETIDDDRVLAFLQELPSPTKCLVTTRHRIDVAYPIRLQGLPPDDGQMLIAEECLKREITLTSAETDILYKRTAGVPLAVIWSVAQMGHGHEVEAVLHRLSNPGGDVARYCFEGAMAHIRNRPAEKLLMVISVLTANLGREELGYIADLPDLDRDDGLDELERLSLVNRERGQFDALPLTKEFALRALRSGETGMNHWDFIVETGPRLADVVAQLGDVQRHADFLLWEVCWMLIMRGKYDVAESNIRRIESSAKSQGLERTQADCWFLLGLMFREKGNLAEAVRWFESAEEFYAKTGSPDALAGLLDRKATALRMSGSLREAEESLRQALILLELPSILEKRRLRQRALVWGDLGFTLSRAKRYREAQDYIDRCLSTLESLDDFVSRDETMATIYIEKAVLAHHLGNHEEALRWAGQAEERIKRSGIKRPICDGDKEWLNLVASPAP